MFFSSCGFFLLGTPENVELKLSKLREPWWPWWPMVDWNHKTIDDGVHSCWPQIRWIRQLWVLKPADPLVVVDLGRGKLNCLWARIDLRWWSLVCLNHYQNRTLTSVISVPWWGLSLVISESGLACCHPGASSLQTLGAWVPWHMQGGVASWWDRTLWEPHACRQLLFGEMSIPLGMKFQSYTIFWQSQVIIFPIQNAINLGTYLDVSSS